MENLKLTNPISCRKPHFHKLRVWKQVKVKKSLELKRYVSQNIWSNSWSCTSNKFDVLAKLLIQALWHFNLIDRLLYLLTLWALIVTHIQFLPTITLPDQTYRSRELMKWSPKIKCCDVRTNSLKQYHKECMKNSVENMHVDVGA